ncbi:9863_t:CDS:2 [Ambispora gerdemannii]|uniref:9863_t:CDS:1 n=1 Tax=Ambispora gerdemannii TaxID=144530 RepID=A0A9N8W1Z8_9GLOM|nr:9863_t:CDS:2 [Ambispora gerdemannii]
MEEIRNSESPDIPEIPEIGDIIQEPLQQEPSVDEELAEHRKLFQAAMSKMENLELYSVGGPLGEYYKAIKSFASLMAKQTSKLPDFPPLTSNHIDSDILKTIDEILLRLDAEIISSGSEQAQLKKQDIELSLEQLWQSFIGIAKASKLKLREFDWVSELSTKVEKVEFEVKKVEAMLEGVLESPDAVSLSSSISSNNGDVTVTGIIFSSSLLDEWYTKIIAVEELAREVIDKVHEFGELYRHPRFRAPPDLSKRVDVIIENFLPSLKSKISDTKEILAHDRRIGRWFDGGNEADKWISETLNRAKQLEVPDFVNKYEWEEEENNLESLVEARRNMIENIAEDAKQFYQEKIEHLILKAKDFKDGIKDFDDQEDQIVVQLMAKQHKTLDQKFNKLTDFITLLLEQTTTENYRILLNHLESIQSMRTNMQSIRKMIIEHNDADLVVDDVNKVEQEIIDFQQQLPKNDNEDTALSKALRQKHTKLLDTIRNIKIALSENRLQMAAYLSPSSPSSPTSSASEFDRLSIDISKRLDNFQAKLISPPTYMIDSESESEEPERVHGLTCSDDHIEDLTESYGSIESDLLSFERSLWVEFWLTSERAKRIRGQEATGRINELETTFIEVKRLMKERNNDIAVIKKGREYAKGIEKIRDQLDAVKAKMSRGETTTDSSIQELDEYMVEAKRLLKELDHLYKDLLSPDAHDQSYLLKYKEYKEFYKIVEDWIEEVRIWFREAERIRIWIEKRIEILENVEKVDVFQTSNISTLVTQEKVDDWQKDFEELEKEVEKFDAGDMARLRAHVKEIMGTQEEANKAMSPADTTTIAITLQTLTILDQLLNTLKKRENELTLLSLRVQWEREFDRAMNVWHSLISEIKDFTINHARWKPPISQTEDGWLQPAQQLEQSEVNTEAENIKDRMSDYKNVSIPPTTELFDEFVDTSYVEVPDHLMTKQENLEERDLQDLEDYFGFSKRVIVQRKDVLDYVLSANLIHKDGLALLQDLIKEESNPRGGKIQQKFNSRVQEINDRVESAWLSKGSRVVYPDDPRHDQAENVRVREGVDQYYRKMRELYDKIVEALRAYERALRLVTLAEEYKEAAKRLDKWIDQQNSLLKKRKVDVFVEKCKYNKQDVETFLTDNNQLVIDIENFKEQDLKPLYEKISALISEVKSIGTKCVNTDELDSIVSGLDNKSVDLDAKVDSHGKELYVLDKRVQWEDQYSDANDWINSTMSKTNRFLTTFESLKNIKEEISNFEENSLKNTQTAFTDLCDIFNILPNIETAPEHIHSRQKKLNDNLLSVKDLSDYTHKVIEQKKSVVDYMNEANEADSYGEKIKSDLTQALSTVLSEGKDDDTNFIERITLFKEKIDKAWRELAEIVPYPSRNKDDNKIVNDVNVDNALKNADDVKFNKSVKDAIEKKNDLLQKLFNNLQELLLDFQRSIALYRSVKACEDKVKELNDWINEKIPIVEARRVDVFADNLSMMNTEVENLMQENKELFAKVQNFEAEDVNTLRAKIQNLLEDIKDAKAKNIDTDPLTTSLKKLENDLETLKNLIQIEANELDAVDKRINWENTHQKSLDWINNAINETKDFTSSKAAWRVDTPEDKSSIEPLDVEFKGIKEKVDSHLSNEIAENKTNYDQFILASDKLTYKEDRRVDIEKRQTLLESNVKKLNDHVDYARALLDQRGVVVEFMSEASNLESIGAELQQQLIDAEKNVASGPSEIDLETKVNEFNNKVKNLWENTGSKVPFPISEIMNEVDHTENSVVKEAVDNRYALLKELGGSLDELHEKYQTSLALQQRANKCLLDSARIQDWIAGRLQILNDRQVDPLVVECTWKESEVQKMQQEHEEFLEENARADVEDISELRRELETLLQDITKADCKSVDQSPLAQALENLNKNFSDLQAISSSRQLELSVLENRARWEEKFASTSNTLDELDRNVNTFIEDQARWSLETRSSEIDLNKIFADLEKQVKEFEEQPLTSTKAKFNELETSINKFLSKETPEHITARQIALNQKFTDLLSRMNFAKQVLAQRDSVDAFMKQADIVQKEGESLKSKIDSAEENGESDSGFSDKLATFKNNLDDLKTNHAEKIVHPNDPLTSEDLNVSIKQAIDDQLALLDALSKELDDLLKSYQDTMDLSGNLAKGLKEAKDIESELDKFIFTKANWESNQNSEDNVINSKETREKLLAELDTIKENLANFDENTLHPVNEKFNNYKSNLEASEKQVPEHVQSLHKTLNDLVDGLKVLDNFARDVIQQRVTVDQYMKDGAQLENEARQIQQILLMNHPSSPGGEGNTVSTVVENFANRVQELWDDLSSKIVYPTCPVQNEEDRMSRTDDSNSVIREAVNAQNESLKSLSNSLNDLLNTHQNVLRRKKMLESYLHQADDIAAWIQPKLDIVQNVANDQNLGEQTEDHLRELIGEVDGVDAARTAYHSAFEFAKSLATSMIEEMALEVEQGGDDVEDIKNDLALVRKKQEEIDQLWDALGSTVPVAKQILDQGLQVVEFKQKADETFAKINELSNVILNTPPEQISPHLKDWQIELNSLEQNDLFSLIKIFDNVQENLKENPSAISDKESKILEDRLQEVNDAISALKKLLSQKIDEAEAYRSSQIASAYMDRARDLQQWINDSVAKFQDSLRYGIMVGNLEEQNKNNWGILSSVFEEFKGEVPERFLQLESIRAEFNDIASQEGIRELDEIMALHSQLDAAWEYLDNATSEMKGFVDKVEQWYNRHETIYHVESEILDGLPDRINKLASINYENLATEVNELDGLIKNANVALDEVKNAATQIVDKPGDIVDQTNRHNFDEHHADALKRLNTLSTSFQVALKAAHNASALAAFHAEVNRIIAACQEESDTIQTRHEDLQNKGFYALEAEDLERVLKYSIEGYDDADEKLSKYDDKINNQLKREADQLIELNPAVNKDRILNIFTKLTEALSQFSEAVSRERSELELVRKVFAHAKTAQDIKSWIQGCKMAVLNIQVDVTDQEVEIADLEEKIADFQHTVDKFQNLSNNLLKHIDDTPYKEDNSRIKEASQQRTNRVLDDWNGLKAMMTSVRSSLNASRENQEVSRTIKDILMAIGQVRERVFNIESYITGGDSIQIPTRDDVESGERELGSIQAEIDHILQPRIDGLDVMISNLTDGGANFIQQRAGIAESLTNLASAIENKKNQLRKAQKLAFFGTKADEMNALMSSLLDVVDDNAPLSSLQMVELQSRKIELDTKYNYYRPRIEEKFKDTKRASEPFKDDWRVEERLSNLSEQWKELDAEAKARKEELQRLLSGRKNRDRSGSIPTIRPYSPVTRVRNSITPKNSNSSLRNNRSPSPRSSRITSYTNPQPARNGTRNPRISSPTRQSPSPTSGTRRPPIRLLPHTVNNYIPKSDDPLDVEVARIVNTCPVKIKVTLVEGEEGKYLFGEVEPKLCYCRILRSRMVMVRVGGGWAELSKFLVEHANLEQKFIPKAQSFVRLDETDPDGSETAFGPGIYEANLRITPKGPGLRIEGEKNGGPLALKHMYTRK